MATPSTCPFCGQPAPLSRGPLGGVLICPNPQCGKVIDTGPTPRAVPRVPGSRPELLDRLPQGFATSAPMIIVGGVFVLLYGLVLFVLVSDWKKKRLEALANTPPETYAYATPPPPPVLPAPPPVASSKTGEVKKPVEPPRKQEPPKPAEPLKTPSGTGVRDDTVKPPDPATKKVSPKAPEPPPPPPPPPPPVVVQWGTLVGSSRDCQLLVEGSVLTIAVPGTPHLIIPEAGLRNAPILLTQDEVRGDFAAQVKVVGKIRPGVEPPPGFPFTFQGAGLLLWQDENNYLRLERTSSQVEGKRLHQVLVELCREGHTLPSTLKNVSDTDIVLRFERHGPEVKCDYSLDGARSWLPIKRQPIPFSSAVRVGVSASNVSPRPFAPRFEAWELTGGAGRGGPRP